MAKTIKNLIRMEDMSRSDIERLIGLANNLREECATKRALPHFILGELFLQESTRTQIGFQSASYRLGGQTITLKDTKFQSSMSSAESLEDTFRIIQSYADIICLRHFDNDVFSRLNKIIKKPIINCGNGYDEHPSQTLIDLMAIKDFRGTIDSVSIAIVGDLRHMRSAHSLLLGLSKFLNVTVHCISPKKLSMPEKYLNIFKKSKNTLLETDKLDLKKIDVVYMAGFQPKTPIGAFSKKSRLGYQINNMILHQLKKDTVILCPLPRIDEITPEVDQTKFAKYFEQSDLGLYMRMAIITELLKK